MKSFECAFVSVNIVCLFKFCDVALQNGHLCPLRLGMSIRVCPCSLDTMTSPVLEREFCIVSLLSFSRRNHHKETDFWCLSSFQFFTQILRLSDLFVSCFFFASNREAIGLSMIVVYQKSIISISFFIYWLFAIPKHSKFYYV